MKTFASSQKLPPDPVWIEFERSDGDPSRWATNTDPTPDASGMVNYMRPSALDEGRAIDWRRSVGMSIAKALGLPDGKNYVLKSWPSAYQFYDHTKTQGDGVMRHDPYLMGSVHVGRFRSPQEFIPHAIWLATDPTMEKINCKCRYCGKTAQRSITENLVRNGLVKGSSPTSARSARPATSRASRTENAFASVRKIPHQTLPPQVSRGPKQFLLPERHQDLVASLSSKRMERKRWARQGELVWCSIVPPIAINPFSPPEDGISFWPALIEGIRLRTHVKLRPKPVEQPKDLPQIAVLPSSQQTGTTDGDQSDDEDVLEPAAVEEEPPWDTSNSAVFKIKLLGVTIERIVPDTHILPYQSYAPPDELLEACRSVKIAIPQPDMSISDLQQRTQKQMNQLYSDFARFQPYLADVTKVVAGPSERFAEAAGPFALSIQIASSLASFWTPTDEWRVRLTLPQTDSSESISAAGPQQSKLRNSYVEQTRFQGLWWGPERIWSDELVRVKVGRDQLAPDGADRIKSPSGPGSSTRTYTNEVQANLSNNAEKVEPVGAASRGVFVKIGSFLIVDAVSETGETRKECRISGVLYELADEDWIEEEETQKQQAATELPEMFTAENGFDSVPVPAPPLPSTPGLPPTSDNQLPQASPQIDAHPPSDVAPLNATLATPQIPISPSKDASDSPLVGPANARYPLPEPPKGFKFRRILEGDSEAVLDLTLLSGRYYPGILSNPIIERTYMKARTESNEMLRNSEAALEGLVSGVYNAVDPSRWMPGRLGMAKEADRIAKAEIFEYWQSLAAAGGY